jgi:hypothetical protein
MKWHLQARVEPRLFDSELNPDIAEEKGKL